MGYGQKCSKLWEMGIDVNNTIPIGVYFYPDWNLILPMRIPIGPNQETLGKQWHLLHITNVNGGRCQQHYPDWDILVSRLKPYFPNEDTNRPQSGNPSVTTTPSALELCALFMFSKQLVLSQEVFTNTDGYRSTCKVVHTQMICDLLQIMIQHTCTQTTDWPSAHKVEGPWFKMAASCVALRCLPLPNVVSNCSRGEARNTT